MKWIVKLAGMFCIMAACVIAGAVLEHRMKKRYCILREMQETLVFLEKEMIYHKAPVQEAFLASAKRCSTELAGILRDTADQIGRRDGKRFQDIWTEAVLKNIPSGVLEQEELNVICETAAALCNMDTVLQKTLLEKYTDRFRQMSSLAFDACREKGSLYRRLAAAAGIFLILIFL